MSYRADWFEQRDLAYFPPILDGDFRPFQCLGIATDTLYRRMTGGEIGKKSAAVRDADSQAVSLSHEVTAKGQSAAPPDDFGSNSVWGVDELAGQI